MPFFLCIETSRQIASVALINDGVCIREELSAQQKEHASFLQSAIKNMIQYSGFSLTDLDAVSVSIGPGSYTGLRVGLASAKGICFAIQKPLITLNTLKLMAYAAREQLVNSRTQYKYLAPMIDARRNEVFTAVYDFELHHIIPPQPLVLDEYAFNEVYNEHICFFGDGSIKWKPQCKIPNALFTDIQITASKMCDLTEQAFDQKQFSALSSTVPFYGKEFYTTSVRN